MILRGQFLSVPAEPAKGSFWEKTPHNVGYVPANPKDHSEGFIGRVTRIGKQYRWAAWGKCIKPGSKLKTEPKAADGRITKRLSNALWAVNNAYKPTDNAEGLDEH